MRLPLRGVSVIPRHLLAWPGDEDTGDWTSGGATAGAEDWDQASPELAYIHDTLLTARSKYETPGSQRLEACLSLAGAHADRDPSQSSLPHEGYGCEDGPGTCGDAMATQTSLQAQAAVGWLIRTFDSGAIRSPPSRFNSKQHR